MLAADVWGSPGMSPAGRKAVHFGLRHLQGQQQQLQCWVASCTKAALLQLVGLASVAAAYNTRMREVAAQQRRVWADQEMGLKSEDGLRNEARRRLTTSLSKLIRQCELQVAELVGFIN
ncbi:unnamed protein product [Polarella glacialis]|uniref:Uncharacterized protein n=1 Tax=Polarella glacialis TaxID=89957 RepID=A0A813GNP5_POLGL|nr:unnamed protein product [Polarella glacialis]